nr:hypothetical protein [Tanacetum cinerariifolium]
SVEGDCFYLRDTIIPIARIGKEADASTI